MHRLFGITFVIAICCHSVGCGGSREQVVDQLIGELKTMAKILEGIETKEDAESAKAKVKASTQRLNALLERAQKLGEPADEVKEKLDAKLEKEMQDLQPRIAKTRIRLSKNPEIISPIIDELTSFDNAMMRLVWRN